MQISGVVKSIERSPYEAFINFVSTNYKGITNLTVQGSDSQILSDLKVGDVYSADSFLWLARAIKVSSSNPVTSINQPQGINGTIVLGCVVSIIDSETIMVQIEGVADNLKVELEQATDIVSGEHLEIRGELHVEI